MVVAADIIRIIVPPTAQGEHHAGEDGLDGLLLLACGGELQGDLGVCLVHLDLGAFAQHIGDGVGGERHGCGDSGADDVGAGLCIAAVAGAAESGDSAALIEKFNAGHSLQSDFFNLDLGIPRIGFVALMKVNDYCREHFVDLEDIHLDSIPHVYFTKSMNRGSDCKCSNYLYNRDLKILEIYMRNYANPNYCESSLVYDGEYLRQGFHQDNIIY